MTELPKAVIFDADSTLFDTSHRHDKSPRQDPTATWESYAALCEHDDVFPAVVALARILKEADYLILIVSARSASVRDQTLKAIERHDIPCDALYLLEESHPQEWHDDHAVFKRETLKNLRTKYSIKLACEDWPHLANMYTEQGVPGLCFNPGYGIHSGDSYNNF